MVFKALTLLCSILLLQGCEDPGVIESPAKSAPVESVAHFSVGGIELESGLSLKIDGRVVRYDLIRNQRGVFDRYIIESPLEPMGLEGAVFWALARNGYVRKVRQDQADRYVVNYVLKGSASLTADYRPWSENGAKSRLVITRKALEQ